MASEPSVLLRRQNGGGAGCQITSCYEAAERAYYYRPHRSVYIRPAATRPVWQLVRDLARKFFPRPPGPEHHLEPHTHSSVGAHPAAAVRAKQLFGEGSPLVGTTLVGCVLVVAGWFLGRRAARSYSEPG